MFITPMSLPIQGISQDITNQTVNSTKPNIPFADVFSSAIDNLKETQAQSTKDDYDLAMGNVDELHRVMINSEKAAAALELTVQLASRAINAYKEISQMQV